MINTKNGIGLHLKNHNTYQDQTMHGKATPTETTTKPTQRTIEEDSETRTTDNNEMLRNTTEYFVFCKRNRHRIHPEHYGILRNTTGYYGIPTTTKNKNTTNDKTKLNNTIRQHREAHQSKECQPSEQQIALVERDVLL